MQTTQIISSNFFRVRKLDGFEQWANRMGFEMETQQKSESETLVRIYNTDGEGYHTFVEVGPTAYEIEMFDIPEDVANQDRDEWNVDPIQDLKLLIDSGSVAVVMQVSHEGSLVSAQVWVILDGDIETMNLHDYAAITMVKKGVDLGTVKHIIANM